MANIVRVCESRVAFKSVVTVSKPSKVVTVTRRRTETIEWRLWDWSSLPSKHVMDNVTQERACSETMQVVGDKWVIEVMPGGSSSSSHNEAVVQRRKEHVAIYLHYVGDSEALCARFSVTLVNQLPGGVDKICGAEGLVITFGQVNSDTTQTSRGLVHIIKRSDLEDESSGWKVDDRVVIRATITTLNDFETTVAANAPAFTPPNTLPDDLKSMLSSGDASDIILNCGQRQFHAHRLILRARSPYFKGLFASVMRDANTDCLSIADTEPDVFEQLLLWVYMGEVAEAALQAKDMLEHLIMAANRYECNDLKLLCEANLCEGLSLENVATRLVLAEQAQADELKEACLELIKPNAAAIMGTEGWKDVMAAGSELISEVMAFVVGAPTAGKDEGQGKKRTADEAGLST